MSTRTATVALLDETGHFSDLLTHWANALTDQMVELREVWHDVRPVHVMPVTTPPMLTWTLRIVADIDEPGALGYHADDGMTPYAVIDGRQLPRDVLVTLSHELLEMAVDPWGNERHGARLPRGVEQHFETFGLPTPKTHVSYLLEPCDPCEATTYEINRFPVSDFLRHAWYRSNPDPHITAYSRAGGCGFPRQVAAGGYVSFEVPVTGHWWQVFADEAGRLSTQDIGRFDAGRHWSLREFTDHHARRARRNMGTLRMLGR